MSELKQRIEKKAKTTKELVESHKENLKQVERELKKAYGAIAIKSVNARFHQKQNEEWVRLSVVLGLLANYKCIPTKQLEEYRQGHVSACHCSLCELLRKLEESK